MEYTKFDGQIIKTQMRFSRDLWNYISDESARLGIAKNAVIAKIIDEYRKNQSTETEPFTSS